MMHRFSLCLSAAIAASLAAFAQSDVVSLSLDQATPGALLIVQLQNVTAKPPEFLAFAFGDGAIVPVAADPLEGGNVRLYVPYVIDRQEELGYRTGSGG